MVVFVFFKMECSRGAVVTLVPSGDREALMKSLPGRERLIELLVCVVPEPGVGCRIVGESWSVRIHGGCGIIQYMFLESWCPQLGMVWMGA